MGRCNGAGDGIDLPSSVSSGVAVGGEGEELGQEGPSTEVALKYADLAAEVLAGEDQQQEELQPQEELLACADEEGPSLEAAALLQEVVEAQDEAVGQTSQRQALKRALVQCPYCDVPHQESSQMMRHIKAKHPEKRAEVETRAGKKLVLAKAAAARGEVMEASRRSTQTASCPFCNITYAVTYLLKHKRRCVAKSQEE